jgi:hypothetical protein
MIVKEVTVEGVTFTVRAVTHAILKKTIRELKKQLKIKDTDGI